MHNKIDVVIMAGGKGERLMPLTQNTPKPLLKIGNKPVIEHITDHLASYGISKIHITVNYLSDQIVAYFKNHNKHQIEINYIKESKSLGTIGALKLNHFNKDYILVMNADLLTNINFECVFNTFKTQDSDALIATVPYDVDMPHDVVEIENGLVTELKLNHASCYNLNAGIYMFKKACLEYIPKNSFFDATDFINILLEKNKKITNYSISEYWLDIGKPEDFNKAQNDIKHIKF
ncbi:NTP transferase domain-containing protein [Winogradskyella sp. F6397]|uniref:NTP transferase domain-containing protein n=1 Tax=Winogradskyella marina TaxID=2785530 RepID=A0ABS0EJ20_9FLAO|nr:sugar phosphate nucleotidyltransferase [Winogradskyella marina]MBF8149475.1 NTP transferase domain-containing protein [Winogradskyella marina]